MKSLTRIATMVGVAAAVAASTLVAQVQKFVAPAAPVIVVTKVEVKVGGAAKATVIGKGAALEKGAVPAKVDAKLDPLIQQFMPQCRPIVRAELHLVTSLCSPTKDQRARITVEGNRLLKEVVTKYAEAQNKMMQGQWRGGQMPNPHKLVEEGIPTLLKPILTPEQLALYRAEVEKRAVDKRQVGVRALVARLDGMLVLTKEQRDKLVDSLSAGWNDSWGLNIEQFFSSYGDRYFPVIPDPLILPTLNEMQKQVYAGTQKIQVNFWGNGFQGGFVMEENEGEVGGDDIAPEVMVAPPAGVATIRVEVKEVTVGKAVQKQEVKTQAKK